MVKRAWVIDDHKLFNAGISRLMLTLDEIDQVESFDNPGSALECSVPDGELCLIVADFFMPGFKIEDWLPKLNTCFPNTPKVVISSSISSIDRSKCFELGADAYYEKHSEPDEVLAGLQQILKDQDFKSEGGSVKSPANHGSSYATTHLVNVNLTTRQLEVLIHLARGYSAKSIAQEFGISPETVKSHLSQTYRKLGVSTRAEASAWARNNGLV